LMLRLRAEAVIGPTAVRRDIERRLDLHREKLALYRQLEANDFPPDDMSREKQLQHLILTAGIMLETLWVEWSEKAIAVLSQPASK
ncbi:MAG: PadR family transcriptional regulator, partial [Noviherbaspirillum sp.]